MQNHLKNFSILLEYRLPCFMSIPINSVTSMSFISRWTSTSCSCVIKNLLLSIVNVFDKITIFCSNQFILSKILKLNFAKVIICKQIIRIFQFCVETRTPFLPLLWVSTPNIPVPHDGCVGILAMQLYKQRL